MGEEQLIYLATVTLTVGGIGLWIGWQMRKQSARTKALQARAHTLGLSFEESAEAWLDANFSGAAWFVRGSGGSVENVLRGQLGGRDVVVFDSHFFQGVGRARDDFDQTVLALRVADLDLPRAVVHPRSWRAGLVRLVGAPSATELDRETAGYRAYCPEHGLRAALLAGPLADALAADPGWWLETEGPYLFISRLGERAEVDALEPFAREALALLELVIAAARRA